MTERWARGRDVLWRQSGDDVVLKRPDEGEFVTLSKGMALWAALELPASVSEVANRIAGVLAGVEPQQLARDIEPLLHDLHSRRLVERWAA